ncbi:MAG: 4Fe-4S dicluster domain-containing protein [Rhodospirillaceae bacterium]
MSKYGMVMDLDRCIGCNACVIACKVEHNSPAEINFTKILEQETGTYPDSKRHFLPVMCNHCDDAPCIDVCPTTATYAREKDGIVLVDWDKCIGCGACILGCPYDQRFHVFDERTLFPDGSDFQRPDVKRAKLGTIAKCDFCYHRIDDEREPACVEVCPTKARIFGEVGGGEEGESIQHLVADDRVWTLLPDKETKPSVFYMSKGEPPCSL